MGLKGAARWRGVQMENMFNRSSILMLVSVTEERRRGKARRAHYSSGFSHGNTAVRRSGRGGGSLLRSGAPLGAAVFDEAEAPHPLCWPVWGRGGKFEVEEIGAAARRSGVARIPDGAVAGEMGEELHHRDLRAVFGGESGEAIGALSHATSTGDPDDDVGEERTSAPGMQRT